MSCGTSLHFGEQKNSYAIATGALQKIVRTEHLCTA